MRNCEDWCVGVLIDLAYQRSEFSESTQNTFFPFNKTSFKKLFIKICTRVTQEMIEGKNLTLKFILRRNKKIYTICEAIIRVYLVIFFCLFTQTGVESCKLHITKKMNMFQYTYSRLR